MILSEIWELSRSNQFTWILPCVLLAGAIAILLSSMIKTTAARRIVKSILLLVFSYAAIWSSSTAIQEKWRIRHEWGKQNWQSLTNKEQMRLMADGGNLTMGPLIYGGGYSFLVFASALLISSIIVRNISRKDSNKALKRIFHLDE